MNETVKASFKEYKKAKKEQSMVEGLLAKFEALVEHVKGYKPPETKVEFPEKMEVTGKVSILDSIKAIVKFPDIQKIVGAVKVNNFPNIFKIEGRVKADVNFPSVQEIKGSVNVKFPKSQAVEMDLSKVIKAIEDGKLTLAEGVEPDKNKANPTRYLPVRLTNGKTFYEIFERIGEGNGKINALLEKLLVKDGVNTPRTVRNGVLTPASGLPSVIASGTGVASVTVKALSTNTVKVYIGDSTVTSAIGFELSAGEAISLDVDNLNDIYAYAHRGDQQIRFIAVQA